MNSQTKLEPFPDIVLITSDPNGVFAWDESLPEWNWIEDFESENAEDGDDAGGAAETQAPPAPMAGEFVFEIEEDNEISFQLPPEATACFSALKTIYATTGRAGVERFFERNNLARLSRAEHGPDEIVADEGAPPLTIEKLLFASNEMVELFSTEAIRKIEEIAAGVGETRLAAAREQIVDETQRYFFKGAGRRREAEGLLSSDAPGSASHFNPAKADSKNMIREWKNLQPVIKVASEAAKKEHDTLSITESKLRRKHDPMGILARENLDDFIFDMLAVDPRLTDLRESTLTAYEEVARRVADAGSRFPILWRTAYKNPRPETMGKTAFGALQSAFKANVELSKTLIGTPEQVWTFPTLIHATRDQAEVPPISIAWTAIEERVQEESGLRLTAVLSLVSGFGRMAIAGGAALGVAIAPPVAVAVVLADIFLNVADAAQEYQGYRLQEKAFLAALDPSMSLAAEPSLFPSVLTITLDLLSVMR